MFVCCMQGFDSCPMDRVKCACRTYRQDAGLSPCRLTKAPFYHGKMSICSSDENIQSHLAAGGR